VGISRKVFYVKCVKKCEHSGVKHEVGNVKKFYSALKAKHFIKNAPEGCFEADGNSETKSKQNKPEEQK
jgi:hypothetical protein